MNNNQLIYLTDNAVNYIKKMQTQKNAPCAFRLSIKKVGCSGLAYVPELVTEAKPTDIQFEQDGLSIYVAENCAQYVKGMTLDFAKSGLNQNWIYNNPNVKGTCGCGESFSVDKKAEGDV